MDYLTYLEKYGCDTGQALKRLNNDVEFYQSCIEIVVSDENLIELKEAVKNRDLKDAFFKAHTLKGILANLSFTPYYEKISQIVEILRSGSFDGVEELVSEFEVTYTEFMSGLVACINQEI